MRDTHIIHDADLDLETDYIRYTVSREADGGQTYVVRSYDDERWYARNVTSGHTIVPNAVIGTRLRMTIARYEETGESVVKF